jgi:hypothetical protein
MKTRYYVSRDIPEVGFSLSVLDDCLNDWFLTLTGDDALNWLLDVY